jgi:hypothetical protein
MLFDGRRPPGRRWSVKQSHPPGPRLRLRAHPRAVRRRGGCRRASHDLPGGRRHRTHRSYDRRPWWEGGGVPGRPSAGGPETSDRVAFNHVGLCVGDLDRSRTFYERALGFAFWWEIDAPDEATPSSVAVESNFSRLRSQTPHMTRPVGAFIFSFAFEKTEGSCGGRLRSRREIAGCGPMPHQ